MAVTSREDQSVSAIVTALSEQADHEDDEVDMEEVQLVTSSNKTKEKDKYDMRELTKALAKVNLPRPKSENCFLASMETLNHQPPPPATTHPSPLPIPTIVPVVLALAQQHHASSPPQPAHPSTLSKSKSGDPLEIIKPSGAGNGKITVPTTQHPQTHHHPLSTPVPQIQIKGGDQQVPKPTEYSSSTGGTKPLPTVTSHSTVTTTTGRPQDSPPSYATVAQTHGGIGLISQSPLPQSTQPKSVSPSAPPIVSSSIGTTVPTVIPQPVTTTTVGPTPTTTTAATTHTSVYGPSYSSSKK